MAKVEVDFRYLDSGWRRETRIMEEEEVKRLLWGSTVIDSDFGGWSESKSLAGITLKLKDGRKCVLSEEHDSSWEGSSVGWINIFVSEEW